ncbi:uncharacterized protein F5Z01DRAFT_671103 [Emericellopsis atlantica]|uniref:Secreted protein n=1 Tax=Emericellopsis atlantica TaxID=2614577 RepID=A0A9P8CUC8_9HYPO|nr:uncharacterized protein F5Z01DRAFT_671103 [Emericellopsis atlantica]KAG9257506.1 hypothetical protein F5Z01DRAFT_671103 [Emericellopsis atlantica]
MKTQVLSMLGLMAVSVVGMPSDPDIGLPQCSHCPPKPPQHGPRSLEIEARGGYNNKKCPKESIYCEKYDHEYYNTYSRFDLSYNEAITCPDQFRYDLKVKVEACSSDKGNKECLKVYYQNGYNSHKRDGGYESIGKSNLGIYLDEHDQYRPESLNYNNYCHGNQCSVPTDSLPGYPNLCGKKIYLAVGNDRCYNNYEYKDDEKYRQSTKHISATVSCKKDEHYDYNKGCKEYCCCYNYGY